MCDDELDDLLRDLLNLYESTEVALQLWAPDLDQSHRYRSHSDPINHLDLWAPR